MTKNKVKTIDDMEKLAEDLKANGKTVVTTNGAFDLLHAAHINLLEKAKNEGDILVVLVNSDERVRAVKGESRPIVPEEERARVIAALACVDYVVVFNNKIEYMKRIKPDVHVKGGSVDPEKLKKEVELVSSWGGKHRVLELEEGFSTTDIVDRILGRFK